MAKILASETLGWFSLPSFSREFFPSHSQAMVEKSLQLIAVVKAQLYGPPSGGAPWFGQVNDG
jgi:hypothetical protein